MNWTEAELQDALKRYGRPLPKARGRKPQHRSGMNKTEAMYAGYLEVQRNYGDVLWWGFECIKARIGHDCWLTPDFLVLYRDGTIELHDTKATNRKSQKYRAEDDAIVKARAVGALYPIPIYFVWRVESGEWARREM